MSLKRLEQLLGRHRLLEGQGGEGGEGESKGGASGEGAGENSGGEGSQGGNSGSGDASGDAKPKVSDAEAKLIREVMEKKGKIKELSEQLTQVNAKLSQFEGIDPTAVRELLAERKKLEEKKLEEQGQWDRLKQQMNDAHAAELSAREAKLAEVVTVNQTLQAQIDELTVGSSFGNSKFIQEELILTPSKARVVYGAHFERKDGQVIAYDKPAGAKDRTMLVDARGEPLGFEEALKKIVSADPDRDQILKSKIAKGAGSSSANSKGTSVPGSAEELSGREKIAKGLANFGKRK